MVLAQPIPGVNRQILSFSLKATDCCGSATLRLRGLTIPRMYEGLKANPYCRLCRVQPPVNAGSFVIGFPIVAEIPAPFRRSTKPARSARPQRRAGHEPSGACSGRLLAETARAPGQTRYSLIPYP